MRSLRLKFAAAAAAIAVVGAMIPGTSIAQPTAPFVATGLIRASQTVFSDSLTELDFILSGCDVSLMVAQGLDAYVFELPAGFPADGAQAVATGDSPVYDLDLAFYGADCVESGPRVGTEVADEAATLPGGTVFVIVKNFIGVQTNATLSVQPGDAPAPEPSEEPSEEPTPSPSPTEDLRVRGEYPDPPNDPDYGNTTLDNYSGLHFAPTQWGMRRIDAAAAWQEERATGFKINVAVVDSGIDLDHPEFLCEDWKLDVVPNSAFAGTEPGPDDENGHGTHVAGIIGACTNNDEGVVGVAPDATLIPIQVLDGGGGGTIVGIAEGIKRAADAGAHVINMSLSAGIGAAPAAGGSVGYLDGFFPEIDAALEYAMDKGVVVVAAAGNDTTLPLCEYPAFYEGVVCVGATDPRDVRTYYSTGPNKLSGEPTLVAPGGTGQVFCDGFAEEIYSTWSIENDDTCDGISGYRGIQGTSMATPHVAGVAALVYDRLGGVRSVANAAKVIEALIGGADDLGVPGADPIFGSGRLNAFGSVTFWPAAPDPTP